MKTAVEPAKTKCLRIAVADDERDTREFMQEALTRLGHEVVVCACSGKQLEQEVRAKSPDLVITDIKMPDGDGILASLAFNRDRIVPVILVSAHHDDETLARVGTNHVMGYLIKPITDADLKTAVAMAWLRYQSMLASTKEAADLRQSLEDRKVIEKAKGIVMKRTRVEEEDAFRRLRSLASRQNSKLVEVCKKVVAAEEIFRDLEQI